MSNTKFSSAAFADTKPHYNILDGLRGAAALMVVWYHVFEGFAFAEGVNGVEGGGLIDVFNHGYLAVDFFFILSGFVISYAYDDRWNRMSLGDFFKRRLVRLHPMVVMGAIIGTITFLIGGCMRWDGTQTPMEGVLVALLLTCCFIPAWAGAGHEVRGNGEMFPLNGPSWSLFFEYIGNICYALFIRRLSNKALAVWVGLTGVVWAWFAITNVSGYEMIGVGWALDTMNFCGGFLRMMFPFSLGMLLARNFKPVKVRGIFWIAIAVLFVLFSVPFFPSVDGLCVNGIYEMFCIMVAFPILVWLGASGLTTDKTSTGVCKFLGDISFPLYIVHYPVMYLFYAWLIENKLYTLAETWQVVILVIVVNVTLAYTALKLYDEPVRKWLTKKLKIGAKK
ncbi:MAG: acyltransferase [Bacteroidaceae bacterium]|nr:acyltransferase [Bacteroidaceae bacterium]